MIKEKKYLPFRVLTFFDLFVGMMFLLGIWDSIDRNFWNWDGCSWMNKNLSNYIMTSLLIFFVFLSSVIVAQRCYINSLKYATVILVLPWAVTIIIMMI